MNMKISLCSAALATGVLMFTGASADTPNSQILKWIEQGKDMQNGIAVALRAVPGKAFRTEIEHEDGRPVYEVSIIKADGKRAEVMVDVEQGVIVKKEVGDLILEFESLRDSHIETVALRTAKVPLSEGVRVAEGTLNAKAYEIMLKKIDPKHEGGDYVPDHPYVYEVHVINRTIRGIVSIDIQDAHIRYLKTKPH